MTSQGWGATGRFFDGESTTEVDIDTSAMRDVWTALQPDVEVLRAAIDEANRKFPRASADTQLVILSALVERYRNAADAVTLRVIVFPFVIWLYVGGAVVVLGAAVALWPRGRRGRPELGAAAAAQEPEAVPA